MTTRRYIPVLLAAALLVLGGCAADEADAAFGGPSPNLIDDSPLVAAENRLFEHDIVGANERYAAGLESDPDDGQLAVGKAITDILLIPYSPAFGRLLTESLGATRPLSPSDNVLYRTEGVLDLSSRGVAFLDDGNLSGIDTLLEGELPWQRGRLASMETFATGQTSPVNAILDNLVVIADEMQPIYDELDIALRDASFGAFFLPGTVFFEDELSLELGKSEVALLRSGVGFVRAAIYFAAAYEASWTLDEAFGARWTELASNPESPEFVDGWTYDDYVRRFLSDRLARTLREPGRLADARDAARDGLLNVRAGLEFGVTRVESNETDRELDFADANLADVRDVIDLVQAIEDSLYGPVPIPFTEPDVTMDLSSFFEDGRTLDGEIPWFGRTVVVDEFGEVVTWQTTDAAYEAFFVAGVFTPEFARGDAPTVQIGSLNAKNTLFDTLAGDLTRTVESTYGTR
jgi:hypothetical protein